MKKSDAIVSPAPQESPPSGAGGSDERVLAKVVKYSISTSSISLAVLVLTFFSQALIAANFGTDVELDNYYIALAIGVYLSNLISRPLIEPLPGFYLHGSTKRQNLLVALVLAILLLGISTALFLCFLPTQVVLFFDSGLSPERVAGILNLGKILMFFPLVTTSIFFTEILLSVSKSFVYPKMLSLINPALMIVLLLTGAQSYGVSLLAFGLFVGNSIQALAGLILLRRANFTLRKAAGTGNGGLRQYLKTCMPLLFATVLGGGTVFIDRSSALRLGSGSVSSLVYAENLVAALTTVLLIPFAGVFYPYLAESQANGGFARMFLSLSRMALAVFVPMSVLVVMQADTIVELIFQRGSFSAHDTSVVGGMFATLIIGLPFMALSYIHGRGILIKQRTWISLAFVPVSLLIKFSANHFFCQEFGIIGIAMSSSLVVMVFSLINLWIVFGTSREFREVLAGTASCLGKLLMLAIPTAMAGEALDIAFNRMKLAPLGGIRDILELAIVVAVTLGIYAFMLDRFKLIPEYSFRKLVLIYKSH